MSLRTSTKILVVDNNMFDLNFISEKLENLGFNIVKAHSGYVALQILEDSSDISVVLVSARIPKMNGYQLTRRLVNSYTDKKLKIIMMVQSCSVSDVRLSINAGAQDLLTKPIDFLVLKHKISNAMNLGNNDWYEHFFEDSQSKVGFVRVKNQISIISFSEVSLKFQIDHEIDINDEVMIFGNVFHEINMDDFVVRVISRKREEDTYLYNGIFVGLSVEGRDALRSYLMDCYRNKKKRNRELHP